MNGLKNQEATLNGIARADPDFHRMQALAREIQISGAMRIVVKKDDGEEMVSFVTFRTEKVSPEIQSDIEELRRLLGLNPSASEFKVRFSALPKNDTEIAVDYALNPQLDANHGGGSRSADGRPCAIVCVRGIRT